MTFVLKVCDLDLKVMPQLGDVAEKNFRPIYTIIININETNERVFFLNAERQAKEQLVPFLKSLV